MITVQIDEATLLDMLMDRVAFWVKDEEVQKLYKDMYRNYIENGCFEGAELNINVIVDNDCINYCTVLSEGDKEYKQVYELAKSGKSDISCETCYSFIEAVNDDFKTILVRH